MADHIAELIASLNPISEDDAEQSLSAERWRAMFDQIVAQDVSEPRRSSRRVVRKVAVPAALVAAAVAVATIVPIVWPKAPGGASQAASDALHHAANAARSQRALPAPGPNQYLYTKIEERDTPMYVPGHGQDNFLFTQRRIVELWASEDGSGREVVEPRGVTFPSAADREAWEQSGEPDLESMRTDGHALPGDRYVLDLSDVPTDPDELLAAIERRDIVAGDDADWVTFQIIGELLHLCYRSPEHRAALYEVAANFPGVDYQGRVTDPAGRQGVSVSYEGGGQRHELIFDPDTAEMLSERVVLMDQEAAGVKLGTDTTPGTVIAFAGPPETVVFWRLFLRVGVVGSTATRP